MSTIGVRFRAIREATGLSVAAFARFIGDKDYRIRDVEREHQRPPFELLALVVEKCSINANWILLGEGAMYRDAKAVPAAMMHAGETDDVGATVEGRVAEEELGLDEVASLARLGTAGGEWRVMEALLHNPPEGMTLNELIAELGEPSREVSAYVRLLLHVGAIDGTGNPPRFALVRQGATQISSRDLPDLKAQGLFAVRQLLKTVLPAAERRRGRLVLLQGRVGEGAAMPLCSEIAEWVKKKALGASKLSGEEERFTVVLAVAAEGETD